MLAVSLALDAQQYAGSNLPTADAIVLGEIRSGHSDVDVAATA